MNILSVSPITHLCAPSICTIFTVARETLEKAKLLGRYSKELKAGSQTHACTWMFMQHSSESQRRKKPNVHNG
jgi:hypothetical protein